MEPRGGGGDGVGGDHNNNGKPFERGVGCAKEVEQKERIHSIKLLGWTILAVASVRPGGNDDDVDANDVDADCCDLTVKGVFAQVAARWREP